MGRNLLNFPYFASRGLYATHTPGTGNCLFQALSDQVYGHRNNHASIRAAVIAYLRDHKDYYKHFSGVNCPPNVRRNPKRKNAGSNVLPQDTAPATPEELDRNFEEYLKCMAKGGTYGGHIELAGFSALFGADIMVWQRDTPAQFVSPENGDEHERVVVHVAYAPEHYESIRNLAGPHTGYPQVMDTDKTPEWHARQLELFELFRSKWECELNAQLDLCSTEPSPPLDDYTYRRLLEDGYLTATSTSTYASSSIERDPDSDDEVISRPSKRRQAQLNRASRAAMKAREEKRRHLMLQLREGNSSQDSVSSSSSSELAEPAGSLAINSEAELDTKAKSAAPASSIFKKEEIEDTDDDWRSVSTKPEDEEFTLTPAKKGPTRLRLLPPKPPVGARSKTQQKQTGPQRCRTTASHHKKQAQRAACKNAALTDPAATTGDKLPIRPLTTLHLGA